MSFLAAIFAPGEQARSDELDRRHRELNQRNAARGTTTLEDLARSDQRMDEQPSVDEQLEAAFEQGAQDGLESMQTGVKRAVNGTVSAAFGFLPPWVWAVAVFAGLVWVANNLGVLNWIRKKLSA